MFSLITAITGEIRLLLKHEHPSVSGHPSLPWYTCTGLNCCSRLYHPRSSWPPLPIWIYWKNMRTGCSKHSWEGNLPLRNPHVFLRSPLRPSYWNFSILSLKFGVFLKKLCCMIKIAFNMSKRAFHMKLVYMEEVGKLSYLLAKMHIKCWVGTELATDVIWTCQSLEHMWYSIRPKLADSCKWKDHFASSVFGGEKMGRDIYLV